MKPEFCPMCGEKELGYEEDASPSDCYAHKECYDRGFDCFCDECKWSGEISSDDDCCYYDKDMNVRDENENTKEEER